MKKIILICLSLIIIISILFYILNLKPQPTSIANINNNKINIEKATTLLERTKGLSFRKSFNENQAMLFVYPKEDYLSFWMVDMNFALDIIWLNKNCKVIYIEKNIQPCPSRNQCPAVTPNKPAQYVLEVVSGFTEKHNISIGDTLEVCHL
jgi:uncharacterized membrane protein (UPF0127 family)